MAWCDLGGGSAFFDWYDSVAPMHGGCMEVRELSAKYLVKPEYKQTEVGLVPDDWDIRTLSKLANIRTGIAKNTGALLSDPVDVPYLRVANVQDGYLDLREVSTIRVERGDLRRFSVLKNDVLMNEGGDLDKLGRGALWQGQIQTCVHQNHVFVVRCKKELLPQFLNAWTSAPQARKYFLLAGRQTTNLASISKSSLGELPVAIPRDLHEQKAIAEALSDADALIESLEHLLTKKRQIKQGAMQELLTGQRRLPGFGGEWVVRALGDIAQIKTGTRNNQDKIEDGEYPFFVRSQNVESIGSYSYDCEAVLVPGEGNIGNIFHYINGKFDLHQRVYGITGFASDVSGKYVYLHMKLKFGEHAMQNSVKATVDSLRLPTFQGFQIRMPSSIEEQTAITSVLSAMDAEISDLEAQVHKTRQLKQGMMQELLTGRIRLI